MRQNNSLLIYGLGFSAREIAKRALAKKWTVYATTRTSANARLLKQQFPHLHIIALEEQQALSTLINATKTCSHVLMSAPTVARENDGTHHDPYLESVPRQSFTGAKWFGYLSTTVVYGNWQGAWVDENSEAKSQSIRGKHRLAAETAWSVINAPIHLFRLAGIYGHGRNALETVLAGKARIINKPGQVFSRIHAEDIGRFIFASMLAPSAIPGQPDIFNVCDDEPCEPGQVIRYACRLLNIEPPSSVAFEDAKLSAMGRSFYEDNKRVRNDKIKSLIGGTMLYPNYRDGLTKEISRLNNNGQFRRNNNERFRLKNNER